MTTSREIAYKSIIFGALATAACSYLFPAMQWFAYPVIAIIVASSAYPALLRMTADEKIIDRGDWPNKPDTNKPDNRRPGWHEGRVTEVVEGSRGHVAVTASHSKQTHFFINDCINAAPEELRRIGAKCWLQYRKTPSPGLWYAEPREE